MSAARGCQRQEYLAERRPPLAKRRGALQLGAVIVANITRGDLTNDYLFSIGGQVLDQRGDAATIVVGKTLELKLRAEADDALNSLLLAVIAKVAFTVTALLFCLAQGHGVMLRFLRRLGPSLVTA